MWRELTAEGGDPSPANELHVLLPPAAPSSQKPAPARSLASDPPQLVPVSPQLAPDSPLEGGHLSPLASAPREAPPSPQQQTSPSPPPAPAPFPPLRATKRQLAIVAAKVLKHLADHLPELRASLAVGCGLYHDDQGKWVAPAGFATTLVDTVASCLVSARRRSAPVGAPDDVFAALARPVDAPDAFEEMPPPPEPPDLGACAFSAAGALDLPPPGGSVRLYGSIVVPRVLPGASEALRVGRRL